MNQLRIVCWKEANKKSHAPTWDMRNTRQLTQFPHLDGNQRIFQTEAQMFILGWEHQPLYQADCNMLNISPEKPFENKKTDKIHPISFPMVLYLPAGLRSQRQSMHIPTFSPKPGFPPTVLRIIGHIASFPFPSPHQEYRQETGNSIHPVLADHIPASKKLRTSHFSSTFVKLDPISLTFRSI